MTADSGQRSYHSVLSPNNSHLQEKRKTVRKKREHNKLSVKCALSRTSWKAVLVGCCFVVVSLLVRKNLGLFGLFCFAFFPPLLLLLLLHFTPSTSRLGGRIMAGCCPMRWPRFNLQGVVLGCTCWYIELVRLVGYT